MFALSRDGKKVFIHQPDGGLAVPILLNVEGRKYRIQIPSVRELEDEFVIYENLGKVRRAVGTGGGDQIDLAVEFSRRYSKLFCDQLRLGNLTVAALRKLVNEHYRQQASPSATEASGKTDAEVPRVRALSLG